MRSVRLPEVKMKNTPWRLETSRSSLREEVDSCGDPNHLIRECPKPPKDNNQRAFIKSSWSDSGEEDDEKVKDETCLVAQASSEICLGVDLEPDEWIKDCGCFKHKTGNQKLFSSYKAYNGGNVIFDSNLRGNIIGKVEYKHVAMNLTRPRLAAATIKNTCTFRILKNLLDRVSQLY
ncbi:hypothetical protein Tco_0078094 [Tanacetum coccineum]